MIFKKPVLSDGITESTFECKRDGLTIRGTIYRPKGDHLPIAIVCHGFMAWQDSVKHYAAFWLKNHRDVCSDRNQRSESGH